MNVNNEINIKTNKAGYKAFATIENSINNLVNKISFKQFIKTCNNVLLFDSSILFHPYNLYKLLDIFLAFNLLILMIFKINFILFFIFYNKTITEVNLWTFLYR